MTISDCNNVLLTDKECVFCPTRDVTLSARIKPGDFLHTYSSIQHREIAKGGKLYEQDGEADHIYVLHDGIVKLEKHLQNGERRIVRLLRNGDLAGIEAVTTASYLHDAIAITSISACEIPADLVFELSHKSSELNASLLKNWQHALMTSDTWLTKFSSGPSRYRVAWLLVWLSENSPDEAFYLPGRADMGNMLALTSETVSRNISELRRDGDLELLSRDIARVDVASLKRIVKDPV